MLPHKPKVRITLIGGFELRIDQRPVHLSYVRARALLACLAALRRPLRREWLAELLMEEGDTAAKLGQLRRMLYILREQLDPRRELIIAHGREALALNGAELQIDFADLQTQLARIDTQGPCPDGCRALLPQGTGALLEDFPPVSVAFDHWLESLRQDNSRRLDQALARCGRLFESSANLPEALAFALARRELDPWNEAACRDRMRLLDSVHGPTRALEEFARFRDRVAADLEIEPAPETRALAAAIHGRLRAEPSAAGLYPLAVVCCRIDPTGPVPLLRAQLIDCINQTRGHAQAAHGVEVFAHFGFPEPDEAASRHALNCARQCARLGAAVGVDSGWAEADPDLGLADSSGHISAQAQYLALHAVPGQVLTSAALAQPGMRVSLPATPQAPATLAIELPRVPPGAEAPMVARDLELGRLLNLWHRARGGHPALALIHGDPGIGKTRLAQALHQRLSQRPWLTLACRQETQHSAHVPLLALLGQDPRLVEHPAAVRLLELARHAKVGVDSLLPGAPFTEGAVELLRSLAAEQSQIVLIEDLHWADAGTHALLHQLADQPPPGLMLLATSRHTQADLNWTLRLELTGLDDAAARAMLQGLPRPHRLSAEDILGRAQGVPLFIEELARAEPGAPLPSNLRDLLCGRILALGEHRPVVEVLALLDEPAPLAQIAAVLGDNPQPGLEAALEAGLLTRTPDGQWSFRHPLSREAAVHGLGAAGQRQLHQRILTVLRDTLDHDAPDRLARHAAGAGKRDTARHYHLRAARQALNRSVLAAADYHINQALERLPSSDSPPSPTPQPSAITELEIRLLQGQILASLHGYGSPQARAAWERARDLAAPLADEPRLFHLFWGLWLGSSSWWDYSVSDDLAARLLRMAERAKAPWMISAACYALGNVRLCLGRFADAIAYLRRAPQPERVAAAQALGEEPGVAALSFLSCALWITGQTQAAQAASRQALDRARDMAHPPSQCFALIFAAVLERYRRAPARVHAHASEARALAASCHLSLWTVAADLMLGWCAAATGDRSGLAAMAATVDAVGQVMGGARAMFLANLADACEQAEAWEEALHATQKGLAECEARGDRHEQAEFERIRARALHALGRPSEAAEWAARAQATARAQGALGFLARMQTNTDL